MFEIGTKIKILASNTKNTASPRKSSIGYVIENGDGFYIVFNKTLNFIASMHRVVFTRYGLENKKIRHEVKQIINLFPVTTKKMTISNSKDYIQNTIKEIKNLKPVNIQRWKEFKNDLFPGMKSAAIVIALPEQNEMTKLGTCDFLEFKAWMNSHILSSIIQSTIYSMVHPINQNFITYPIYNKYLVILRNMFKNKYSIQKSLKEVSVHTNNPDEKENRLELVRAINIIKTVEYTKTHKRHLNTFIERVKSGKMMSPDGALLFGSIHHYFGTYLFDKHLIAEKIKSIKNITNKNGEEALKLLNNITTVQNTLNNFN